MWGPHNCNLIRVWSIIYSNPKKDYSMCVCVCVCVYTAAWILNPKDSRNII